MRGSGTEITRAADAAPELVRHVIYLAAALPLDREMLSRGIKLRMVGLPPNDGDQSCAISRARCRATC